jgi:hypothetical protein
MISAIYAGTVMHRRLRPRAHYLRYAAFWMLLDLDEIDALAGRLRLFSRLRFNVFSFHDCDHGQQSAEPLRLQVERHLHAAGISLDGGAIRLFCMPRVFGYAFNPLSIYFCYHADGMLKALIYEVRNTFGERHSYLIPVTRDDNVIRQNCDKRFYVSPFMEMDLLYDFRVVAPGDRVTVAITASNAQGPVIAAALGGRRLPFTDEVLLRLAARMPLVTFKVIAAIHWQALKMWWKGFVLVPRPPKPAQPLTAVRAEDVP